VHEALVVLVASRHAKHYPAHALLFHQVFEEGDIRFQHILVGGYRCAFLKLALEQLLRIFL